MGNHQERKVVCYIRIKIPVTVVKEITTFKIMIVMEFLKIKGYRIVYTIHLKLNVKAVKRGTSPMI